MYIYEQQDWPRFRWDKDAIADLLADVRHRQGRLIGRMESLGFSLREEAVLQTLTNDALKTSEIEGEKLDGGQVRSSIARRLGIDVGALTSADRNVEGIVEMLLDATREYDRPLTDQRLFAWHAALFPTGRSGMRRIRVGEWRDDSSGPMTVSSGPIAKEKVHFEAPAAASLPAEMQDFLDWTNADPEVDLVCRSALAHLWFVTIHPFDDGNGRMARAISDMLLARSEKSPQRFYSMSAQIRSERSEYYEILERTQKGALDVTPWLQWFLGCMGRAIDGAQTSLGTILGKARFWERHREKTLNDRQRKVLNRLLSGFDGKLTSTRYAKLAGCSQDTAGRDLSALVEQGMLMPGSAKGRSTSYDLVMDEAAAEVR